MMTIEERHNMRPLADIHKGAMKIKYGVVHAQLVITEGKIVEIVGSQVQRINVGPGESTKAASLILAELKKLYEDKQTGEVTFTLKLDQGEISRVSIHRQLRNSYERESVEEYLQSTKKPDNL